MDNTNKFKATVEWMKEKYNEMNQKLFGGELGDCLFTVDKKRIRTLGWFRMNYIADAYYDCYRRMYVISDDSKKIYINKDNFFQYCQPIIGLNSLYSGTEKSLLSTLVHEMCHYYTYMFGRMPKQAHGVEFRHIALAVASRSSGIFTIQRIASAEEMSEYELDFDAKEKYDKATSKRMLGCTLLLVYRDNGNIELIVTKERSLINKIFRIAEEGRTYGGRITQIKTSTSDEALDIYKKHGYTHVFKSYRYFPKTKDDEIIKELENTDMETHTFNQPALSLREVIQKAVKEAIDKEIYGQKRLKNNKGFRISPDINLGKFSPIELNGHDFE